MGPNARCRPVAASRATGQTDGKPSLNLRSCGRAVGRSLAPLASKVGSELARSEGHYFLPSPSFSIASCASISMADTSATVTRRFVARVRMCS